LSLIILGCFDIFGNAIVSGYNCQIVALQHHIFFFKKFVVICEAMTKSFVINRGMCLEQKPWTLISWRCFAFLSSQLAMNYVKKTNSMK
jgi:hypothetical protein